jgi:iron complex transport system ATP-binding protein
MSGAVEAIDLNFSYGAEAFLRQITFSVEKGEMLMILGPNGSGKTTLLKCLVNLLPYSGRVHVMKQDPKILSPSERSRIIAYVPQNHEPAFPYRLIDVVVSGRIAGFSIAGPSAKDFDIALTALNTVGLSAHSQRPYTRISGGELRLVFLARALAQQAKILFLDEPTSNLDIKNRVLTLKILKNLSQSGKTMILTEHDPNLAASFATRILLMKNGRIMGYGTPEEIMTTDLLGSIYDIEIEILRKNDRIHIFPAPI